MPGGDKYGEASGTSMACPVVAGTAALIMSYYPALSAQQIKYVIEKSANQINEVVKQPGSDLTVPFNELSKSGGLLNAYSAIQLASTLKGERKMAKEKLPKPSIKKSSKQ